MSGVKESQDAVSALNDFKVVDRPLEAAMNSRTGEKYIKLLNALKYLASDKTIELPEGYRGDITFDSFRQGMKNAAKKVGMRVDVIEKGKVMLVFTKG